MCVRRLLRNDSFTLIPGVTFSEKTSNQKNQAIEEFAHTHIHTHAPKSHTKQAEGLRSCFQEAVIKSEEE